MSECIHIGGQISQNGKCMGCTMSKWDKPQVLENLDVAFGPRNGMELIVPEWLDIPEEFKGKNIWTQKVDDWFFKGMEVTNIVMKNEVDRKMALRHLSCIMHSFELSHEHKTAGVAYLMSLWFEKFEYKIPVKQSNGDI